jgi:hypothetical protein
MSGPGTASGSGSGGTGEENNEERSGRPIILTNRRRSRSRSLPEIISFDTWPNNNLIAEINRCASELQDYALGNRHAGNTDTIFDLTNRIERASQIIGERHERIVGENNTTENRLRELGNENNRLRVENNRLRELGNENNRLRNENNTLRELGNRVRELENISSSTRELRNENTRLRDDLNNVLIESQRIERNYDTLNNELRGQLYQAEREIERIERNRITVNNELRRRLFQTRRERDHNLTLFRAERVTTRILTRRRVILTQQNFALRFINRQLQIRLMNAPINAALPPPQPVDQVWLLLH